MLYYTYNYTPFKCRFRCRSGCRSQPKWNTIKTAEPIIMFRQCSKLFLKDHPKHSWVLRFFPAHFDPFQSLGLVFCMFLLGLPPFQGQPMLMPVSHHLYLWTTHNKLFINIFSSHFCICSQPSAVNTSHVKEEIKSVLANVSAPHHRSSEFQIYPNPGKIHQTWMILWLLFAII